MNNASSPYLAFVSLARFDQKISEKSLLSTRLLHEIDDAVREIEIAQQRIAEAQEKMHALRKSIDEKELELKILKERERDSKRKLDVVASVKEYTSLQHELEDLIKAQDVLENTVLSLLQEYDESCIVVQQTQDTADTIQQKSNLLIENKRKQIASLAHEIEDILEERKRIVLLVQPAILQQYEAMREKVPNPAVPVKDNTCSACLYAITAQDLTAIRHHKMVLCKDCYRFLYENV